MAHPLSYRRGHRVADGVVAEAVDPVRLLLVEVAGEGPILRETLRQLGLVRDEPTDPTIRIPHVVPGPVGSGVPGRLRVDAVGDRFYEGSPLRISKDCLKDGGRFLPIRSTRRRMPVAAFWLKKYFSGTSPVSMHGNNVDSTTLLGDSEVFTVKHTPRDVIPEFVQRLEYDCEVSSSVARQKAVDVFEDNGSWRTSSNEAHKVVKESRLGPSKPTSRPHSCKREVLAWESCCPYFSVRDFCVIEGPDIFVEGQARPMLLEDFSAEGFDLTLEYDLEAGSLEAKIKSSNAGEEGCNFVNQGTPPG